jgi:hypothetical protein
MDSLSLKMLFLVTIILIYIEPKGLLQGLPKPAIQLYHEPI